MIAPFHILSWAISRSPNSYNQIEDAACIDDLVRTCDWNYFVSAPRSTQETERPVFIVGMPRSGTTLIEQILASHPDVYGLGEVSVIPAIIRDLQSYLGVGATYPRSLRNLTPTILELNCIHLSGTYRCIMPDRYSTGYRQDSGEFFAHWARYYSYFQSKDYSLRA